MELAQGKFFGHRVGPGLVSPGINVAEWMKSDGVEESSLAEGNQQSFPHMERPSRLIHGRLPQEDLLLGVKTLSHILGVVKDRLLCLVAGTMEDL